MECYTKQKSAENRLKQGFDNLHEEYKILLGRRGIELGGDSDSSGMIQPLNCLYISFFAAEAV